VKNEFSMTTQKYLRAKKVSKNIAEFPPSITLTLIFFSDRESVVLRTITTVILVDVFAKSIII